MTFSSWFARFPKRLLATAGIFVLIGCVIASVAVLIRQRDLPAEKVVGGSWPSRGTANTKPSEYAGPQACVACHAERVAEYQQTNHARTCRVPDSASLKHLLPNGSARFNTHQPDLHYEVTRNGSELIQTAVRRGSNGERRTASRVDLILGAGNIDEVHLAWHDDGRMFELPIAWINSRQEWGAAAWWRAGHFEISGPPDGARLLTVRCLECHNTWFHHVPGTDNQYLRHELLTGVSCENCHGPARKHIEFHQFHPDDATPHAIVRPATLSRQRLIEVCTQCHGHAIKHRGPALSYRPGEPLGDYYRTSRSRYTEDDHVANQIHYLKQCRCFQQDDTLTCTTCHNPHRTSGTASPARIENTCLKCHQRTDCGERPGLPAAIQDKCHDCHMPSYLKINVNFQTEHDDYVPPIRRFEHRIAVHPPARDEVLRDWHRSRSSARSREQADRLTHELADYWLSQADDCRRQSRYMGQIAACREALRFTDSPAVRNRLNEAIQTQQKVESLWAQALRLIDSGKSDLARPLLQQLLELKPDHAAAHGKLGTIYALEKQDDLARQNLARVVELDPDDAYGESMLGWLAYLKGDSAKAVEYFRRADEIEPYNAMINLRLGMSLAQQNQLADASKHLRKAIEIDPRNLEAHQHLVTALRTQGQSAEAIPFARRTVELTDSKDIDALLILAETSAEAHDFASAVAATQQALKLAELSQSRQIEALKRRLGTYQSRAVRGTR